VAAVGGAAALSRLHDLNRKTRQKEGVSSGGMAKLFPDRSVQHCGPPVRRPICDFLLPVFYRFGFSRFDWLILTVSYVSFLFFIFCFYFRNIF
jgi:hypothetical protein